ncbi:MAG: RNA polymerase sigma factor SigZ [Bacteroidales bacterium]|nr:MAG: RNA polymerase sigma factor SigZ [Bacteroidales bacterium]
MTDNIELIWKDYHDRLLAFIQKRVNNNNISEDILQDVFVKILTRINTLRDTSKLQSWLYQVTRNAISDYYRDKEKAEKIPAGVLKLESEDEDNMMKEAESWIGCLVKGLPDIYREAIELSELKGVPQKDIARKLNISYVNARSRVQRGRNMMKDKLTECCLFNVDVYGNILDYKGKGNKRGLC